MADPWTPGPWRADGEGVTDAAGNVLLTFVRDPVDARLIAAAPEMAAALERWREFSKADPYYTEPLDDLPGLTDALLARIRGEA